MSVLESLKKIKENVNQINKKVEIIVVSKTFSLDKVQPLINSGHIHYGENKVQEAKEKWSQYLDTNSNIKLHMIGRLQTNKAYDAVKLFDYIHSLDSEKLAIKLSLYEKDMSKKLKYFIQVNVDDEVHKSGIAPDKLKDFFKFCKIDYGLNVIGLMCLPSVKSDPSIVFSKFKILAKNLNLAELSMGMSGDYKVAIQNEATFIRIGSSIFGNRD
ncbi:COG0325 Predicted enzyme with a TIM-barrel fold [Candidatus Pelagibacterales bacterium]